MRYGVLIFPDVRWSIAQERWMLAAKLGFHHAWTYDHLTWRSLQNRTWFGPIPTLTAADSATKSIRIGTMVASPNFRHPAPFAKELMTVDDISNCRLSLGFGAGADGFDANAIRRESWSASERLERFHEFVSALDLLLTQDKSNYKGNYYLANESRAIPGCIQQPRIPFALAATGSRGLKLVTQFAQTWVAVDSRGAGTSQIEKLEQVCRQENRDSATLEKLVLLGHATDPLQSATAFSDLEIDYTRGVLDPRRPFT